jgi:cell wall-associated NlpC family hydrolase
VLPFVLHKFIFAALCVLILGTAAPAFAATDEAEAGQHLADFAQEYVGSRYVWGGTGPYGFDCTGFVQFVYGEFGISLPRNEAGQLASGERVSGDEVQPGDILVFANTYRRGLSHVGIYLGEGRFVHAVDEAHGVTVSNLWDSYWSPRFVGASRALS